jgi:hypothetical protein
MKRLSNLLKHMKPKEKMNQMRKKQHKRKITNRMNMMKKLNKKVPTVMAADMTIRLKNGIQLLSNRQESQKSTKGKGNQLSKTLKLKTISRKDGEVEEIEEEVATVEETEKEGMK